MSIVRDTVNEVIRSNHGNTSLGLYQRTVDQVVTALEEGLENAVTSLRERAAREGLRPQMVDDALVEAGLMQAQPEPETAPDSGLEARVSRIEGVLTRLEGIASRAERRGLI